MIDRMACGLSEESTFEQYAVQIALVREPNAMDQPRLDRPEAVARAFDALQHMDREVMAVAILDSFHRLVGIHAASVGTRVSAPVSPADLFKAAILSNASGIILVHNHPSGRMEFSPDDVNVTRRMLEAGKAIGIDVLDHVIVGGGRWLSLREQRREIFL